jgi:hypothetical protein
MVHFERDSCGQAVCTAVLPLCQQIVPEFDTEEGPFLVVEVSNSWVLEQLRVEAHEFIGERAYGAKAAQALYPGLDIVYP